LRLISVLPVHRDLYPTMYTAASFVLDMSSRPRRDTSSNGERQPANEYPAQRNTSCAQNTPSTTEHPQFDMNASDRRVPSGKHAPVSHPSTALSDGGRWSTCRMCGCWVWMHVRRVGPESSLPARR